MASGWQLFHLIQQTCQEHLFHAGALCLEVQELEGNKAGLVGAQREVHKLNRNTKYIVDSLMQKIYTEHLLSGKALLQVWRYSREQSGKVLCSQGA